MPDSRHVLVPLLREALAPLDDRIAAALVFGSMARGEAFARELMDKPTLWVKGGAMTLQNWRNLQSLSSRRISWWI